MSCKVKYENQLKSVNKTVKTKTFKKFVQFKSHVFIAIKEENPQVNKNCLCVQGRANKLAHEIVFV